MFWNINYYEYLGETPLSKAVRAGHADVVKILLAHGGNPNKKDMMGM